jgi:hypothetical protein
MRGFSFVCMFVVFGAVSAHADLTDPATMANAIRQAGSECNEVKSMKKSEDPKEARVYHVVCDEGTKYRVLLQPDDTVLVEND